MVRQIIFGLTGQFGSGCTTLKDILHDKYNFKAYAFSDLISRVAKRRGINNPTRWQLQDIGNEYRQKDPAYWAKRIIKKIDTPHKPKTNYVIDGFRNTKEIEQFRHVFHNNFYLIAVNAEDKAIRWQRQKQIYDRNKQTSDQFDLDDARDRGERFDYGQQVTKCIGEADIMIDNTKQCYFTNQVVGILNKKMKRYIGILKEPQKWTLHPIEKCMYLAYIKGESSPCLQRNVGTVIFSKEKKFLAYGYNSPPFRGGCQKKFNGCHKDQRMYKLWEKMWTWVEGKKCPNCNQTLRNLQQSNYYCNKCKFDIKALVIPTKGADHCIAIHAEDMAISTINKMRLKGSVLFTTTFPCLQCALKIIDAKIAKVYYVEPYHLPETDMIREELFKKKVRITQFEGIKNRKTIKSFLK